MHDTQLILVLRWKWVVGGGTMSRVKLKQDTGRLRSMW